MNPNPKTLRDIVAEKPFPDYQQWWAMGETFLHFMSTAIVHEWHLLANNTGDLSVVKSYVEEYLEVVYSRQSTITLVDDFINGVRLPIIQSGEFDALSYGFFRSAFEMMEGETGSASARVATERRAFTKRVGKRFYDAVHDHLALELPTALNTHTDFEQLQNAIQQVGAFMEAQGYLRDHFRFTFEVHLPHHGNAIDQSESQFLENLYHREGGYALYEMGYPVILPSAVYLYNKIGEAQHHSTRTIEELFARVGYEARETDDFDPTGFPSDLVIELWEIRLVI
jgi:hypothetical protein